MKLNKFTGSEQEFIIQKVAECTVKYVELIHTINELKDKYKRYCTRKCTMERDEISKLYAKLNNISEYRNSGIKGLSSDLVIKIKNLLLEYDDLAENEILQLLNNFDNFSKLDYIIDNIKKVQNDSFLSSNGNISINKKELLSMLEELKERREKDGV